MAIGRSRITRRTIILSLAAVATGLTLYSRLWLPPNPYVERGLFLTLFFVIAVLLMEPPKSRIGKVLMVICTSMVLLGTIYPIIVHARLTEHIGYASETEFYIFLTLVIGYSFLLSRLSGGLPMLVLMWVMVLYCSFGQQIPGYFGLPPLSIEWIATTLYIHLESGLFGWFTEVSVRMITIFMVFAALLITLGLGDVFTAVASWLAGNATGGPAKVAVFSSALFGMLSGSPVVNVVATGSFTIPTMKSVGYEPRVAASVEALASTGGNLMPPVMGVAAFLMADILGIPYLKVCLAAVVPVFLWYFTCYCTVHYYALGHKIKKWRLPREELMTVLKGKGHLLLAIPALVGGLVYFAAAEQGALWAIVALLCLSCVRKETRLTKAKIVEVLDRFAKMYPPLFVVTRALAIFIGGFTGSGVHMKLGLVLLGGIEQWYIILLIASVMIVILGMAVPITASYLASVFILAPILGRMGYNLLVIHMFVFYLATLAPLTPPVCMASFTAARIAGADPMKTGVETALKSLPLFIIPFSIFKKALILGIGTPLSVIAMGVAVLAFGVFMFTIASENYFQRKLRMPERIIAYVVGIMIVQPLSDFCSYIFIVVGILLVAYLRKSKMRDFKGIEVK
jgi:TRAP transporter 4TM/12TM fusion protein